MLGSAFAGDARSGTNTGAATLLSYHHFGKGVCHKAGERGGPALKAVLDAQFDTSTANFDGHAGRDGPMKEVP
jgi:hypothetical protein